ncbi:MAG: hypothetical protein Q9219_000963 [cf. Caloplaca sp. 3 TL-2023]
MAPIVHLVRHAQAVHNLTIANHNMPDPPLTTFGEEQCRELCSKFPHHSSIKLVVTSPLRRTIQTALLAFEPDVLRGIECIALPEIQETSDLPCDTGSHLDTLKEDFKNRPISLDLVPEDWNSKQGKWAGNQDAIQMRCREARNWLKARDEQVIVVVTHGGLLHYLTEDWTGSEKYVGTGWANTEFRSYRFVDGDDENASVEETLESKARRGFQEKPLTKEEKLQLRETATKNWKEEGYGKAKC